MWVSHLKTWFFAIKSCTLSIYTFAYILFLQLLFFTFIMFIQCNKWNNTYSNVKCMRQGGPWTPQTERDRRETEEFWGFHFACLYGCYASVCGQFAYLCYCFMFSLVVNVSLWLFCFLQVVLHAFVVILLLCDYFASVCGHFARLCCLHRFVNILHLLVVISLLFVNISFLWLFFFVSLLSFEFPAKNVNVLSYRDPWACSYMPVH